MKRELKIKNFDSDELVTVSTDGIETVKDLKNYLLEANNLKLDGFAFINSQTFVEYTLDSAILPETGILFLIKMKNSSGCMNVSTNSEKEFYELLGINYDLDDLGYNDLMKLGASLKKNEFFKDVEVLLTGKRAELCNNISSAINKAFEIWQKQKVTNEVGVVNAVTDDPVVTLEVEFYGNTINLPVHLSTIKKALNDANISLEKSIETKEVIVEKKVEVIPEGYMKINPKTSSIISQEEIAKRQNMIKEEISSRNKHIK